MLAPRILVCVCLPTALFAQAGQLDPSFGQGGFVQLAIPSQEVSAIALQADGRILFAINESSTPSLVRLMPDGTPDTSFGTNGVAPLAIAGINAVPEATSLTIQPDGKIIAIGTSFAGRVNDDNFVARMLANGQPDTQFGAGGAVLNPVPYFANVGLLDSAGNIFVAGGDYTSNLTDIAKLTSRGGFDKGFGLGGVAEFAKLVGPINALALQSDEKILLLGSKDARLTATGRLDSKLAGGKVAARANLLADAFDETGRYLISYSGTGVVLTTRYLQNNRTDRRWTTASVNYGYPGGATGNEATAMAFDNEGHPLVAGIDVSSGGDGAYGIVRYLNNGKPDPAFGKNGSTYDTFGGFVSGQLVGLAVQPYDKIIEAVSVLQKNGALTTVVARYLSK